MCAFAPHYNILLIKPIFAFEQQGPGLLQLI